MLNVTLKSPQFPTVFFEDIFKKKNVKNIILVRIILKKCSYYNVVNISLIIKRRDRIRINIKQLDYNLTLLFYTFIPKNKNVDSKIVI